MLVVDGQLHGDAQRHAARDDGDLVQRIGVGQHRRHQRVAGLVIGRVALFGVADDHRFALGAHQDLVLGQLEIDHHDDLAVLPRGVQRRFVHQVGQIGAGQTRRAARQHRKIHVVAQRNLLGVDPQDGLAALHVGTAHHHAAVETAGPQQRRIEHVGAVGGGHQDDAFVRFEAVHFHQQLVQGLLALIVAAAQAGAAMAAHGVDFIDEDDAGRVLLALLEQVAHAAGAHADEHLHEVRTGDGEERHAGFAGDGARQQGLAGSRRADQQHALGNAAAQLLEFLRLAQELDDLLQLFLGLFHAGHVLERDLLLLRGMQARAALAEAQGLVAAALHLPHHEDPESRYPRAKVALNFSNPLELLVAVVLSAQCTDQRVNIVTANLFKKYKTVADYAGADLKAFQKDIYSTGFYRNKSKNIIATAKIIVSDFKSKVPSAMEDLLRLPGVARKTANIILFDGFGKIEGIAVDTHVGRLSRRLGLTKNIDPDKVEQDLISQVERKDWGEINHLLVTHGRQVCQAKRPLCDKCCLLKLCPQIGVV